MKNLIAFARRKPVVVILILVFIAAAIAYFGPMSSDDPGGAGTRGGRQGRLITSAPIALPDGWQDQAPTQPERRIGVMRKLQHANPPGNVVFRAVRTELAEDFSVQNLPNDLEKSFKREIANFSLVSKSTTKVGEHDAAQIRYREQTSRQRGQYETVMVVIPTDQQTFYVSFRSPVANFTQTEDDISRILDSFGGYLRERNV